MSAKGQKRTSPASFDYLVSGSEQRRRHIEAEHPGGPGIDGQLELVRLHDRQVRRLGALEDAAGIDADLTKRILDAGSVAYQPTGFDIVAQRICRGEPVERGSPPVVKTIGIVVVAAFATRLAGVLV